eukprot:8562210-Pyramimonas_sp.AAC.2
MRCGPRREGAPARDFLATHSQTRLPRHTSPILRLREPENDDNPGLSLTDEAPSSYFPHTQASGARDRRQSQVLR